MATKKPPTKTPVVKTVLKRPATKSKAQVRRDQYAKIDDARVIMNAAYAEVQVARRHVARAGANDHQLVAKPAVAEALIVANKASRTYVEARDAFDKAKRQARRSTHR